MVQAELGDEFKNLELSLKEVCLTLDYINLLHVSSTATRRVLTPVWNDFLSKSYALLEPMYESIDLTVYVINF